MKNFFIYVALCCSFFASCQNSISKSNDNDNSGDSPQASKKISKRDYSITRTNSYSDLFLDSSSLETFIKQKDINDSIARRMRSFYNTRNYQFAWFTSAGLTEQA